MLYPFRICSEILFMLVLFSSASSLLFFVQSYKLIKLHWTKGCEPRGIRLSHRIRQGKELTKLGTSREEAFITLPNDPLDKSWFNLKSIRFPRGTWHAQELSQISRHPLTRDSFLRHQEGIRVAICFLLQTESLGRKFFLCKKLFLCSIPFRSCRPEDSSLRTYCREPNALKFIKPVTFSRLRRTLADENTFLRSEKPASSLRMAHPRVAWFLWAQIVTLCHK